MGNRGCLHDAHRRLGAARWRSKLWICCALAWKGVRRDPMPPGRWTALFFLDEATALAAGHRPCAYCRRGAYTAFAEAWRSALGLEAPPQAAAMDAVLHAERVEPRTRRQRTHLARVEQLPDGAMVRLGGQPALVVDHRLRSWSLDSYGPTVEVSGQVEVLTPPSTVAALRAGYRPILHPSAR